MKALTRKENNGGEYGPAMRALPSDRWRAFVDFFLLEKPGRGAQTAAARRAGFGTPNTRPVNMARTAYRLMQDERMIAAIAEEARKMLRGAAPEAVKALHNMVRDPTHKDHARAVAMMLDRTDPVVTNQNISVTHRHVDPVAEEIEELRALRQLGTSREKLLELFGGNGLARIEALEAEDAAKNAKIIEAEVIETQEEGDGQTQAG